MKGLIKQALSQYLVEIEEILPSSYLEQYKLPNRQDAITFLHIPESPLELKHARRRFVYEELLLFQLKMNLLKQKKRIESGGVAQQIDMASTEKFKKKLPFALTNAQEKALKEILKDMTEAIQMNRLLQGDVGSGKTAVATICLYASVTAGFQGALMVPTEILAEQHDESLQQMIGDNANIALLTSSIKGNKRSEEHTSELQSRGQLVCRLLLEKKKRRHRE